MERIVAIGFPATCRGPVGAFAIGSTVLAAPLVNFVRTDGDALGVIDAELRVDSIGVYTEQRFWIESVVRLSWSPRIPLTSFPSNKIGESMCHHQLHWSAFTRKCERMRGHA